ncbi:MAG: MBL fold metallo-hydrolase [Gemmatimonadales bacterium]
MRRFVGLAVLAAAAPLAAQEAVEIESIDLAPGIHMLIGRGGNIGVSSGPDGVFLIDDQYAPLTERIVGAIREFTDGPIRFVLNTHWHGDHTGGNENLGKAGALIVAHDNVRERMSVEQFMEAFDRRVPASPQDALPVVTFGETVTFHLNGDEIHVFHVPHAHTDGDVIVHFRNANVVHMGDTYFAGRYPFIDIGSGGSIDGVIAAADVALELMDDETKVIPGHGALSTKADLRQYRDVLATVRDRVAQAMAAGRSLDDIKSAGLTSEWDATWGGGSINPERFIESVHASLQEAGEGR